MLVPRGTHELRLLSQSLHLTPAAEIEWTQDVFGNLVATASFATSTDELLISADITVEQCAPSWPIFRIAPGAHAYPFRYSESETQDLGALLHPQHPDEAGRLDRWARGFVRGPSTDTLSLLNDLNAGVADAAAYRTRDEEGTQSPLETLSLASGSCRDLAALFIDAVRRLGFGARAVSGYLYNPDTPPDAAESTHAWAEVYLPTAGWIAFDPTHRRLGSANLIAWRLGVATRRSCRSAATTQVTRMMLLVWKCGSPLYRYEGRRRSLLTTATRAFQENPIGNGFLESGLTKAIAGGQYCPTFPFEVLNRQAVAFGNSNPFASMRISSWSRSDSQPTGAPYSPCPSINVCSSARDWPCCFRSSSKGGSFPLRASR